MILPNLFIIVESLTAEWVIDMQNEQQTDPAYSSSCENGICSLGNWRPAAKPSAKQEGGSGPVDSAHKPDSRRN
jgi:hypothetical protein